MKPLRIVAVLLMAVGAFSVNVSGASAVPPFPSSFYGTVKLDGVNVPQDTQVTAFINGVQYASSPYNLYGDDTVYSLNVPGDDPSTPIIEGGAAGDTVVFLVGNFVADQTAPWMGGGNVQRDLTASSSNTPTATPTSSPTSTSTHTYTPTSTSTHTSTPTNTSTHTSTSSPTSTYTNSSTFTPTFTLSPTRTYTNTPEGQRQRIFLPLMLH